MTARELLKELEELTEKEKDEDVYKTNEYNTKLADIQRVKVWPDMIVLE